MTLSMMLTSVAAAVSAETDWSIPTETLAFFDHMPRDWNVYLNFIFEDEDAYRIYEHLDVRGPALDVYLKELGFTGMTLKEKERMKAAKPVRRHHRQATLKEYHFYG